LSYCMYLRKSRADLEAEARGEGETLKRHEKILLELAKKLNINVTKIYREIVSGETIAARPVMQELLSDVEKGMWDGVLVVEVERLARGDTMDQGLVAQTFKYSGTKIITPMKTYDPNNEFDEEYFEFGLFMSRREYKTINRRLQRGRMVSVKDGKYVGNIPPYGYRRKKLENDSGYTLEPDPDEAKIVELIYKWYTGPERLGITKIRNRLNEMKIPTRKGGDWTESTIRDILSNPVYIGKIRWRARPQVKKMINGEMVKSRPRAKDAIIVNGLHPAIIDEETFNLAQKYLAENPHLPIPTRYKVSNPLAGLVVCGVCGRRMKRRPYGGRYPDTLMCDGPTCNNVSSQLSLVEEKILEALKQWLEKYKIEINDQKSSENLEIEVLRKSIESMERELETLNKQVSSLYDLLEQGIYTTEIFLERSKILNERIADVTADKKALEEKLKEVFAREEGKKNIIPKEEKVINLYWKMQTPKEKNDLLKEVIDKVIYIKEVGGRWHAKPDDFQLELFPKIPK
jgi:site-specific DNA recombinase